MTDDDVVARLRDHERAARSEDALWERVAAGAASPEEIAELERRAADEPEVARMLEATRPLGDDAASRIASYVAPSGRADTRVVALDARRARPLARRIATYAGPLALAAALMVYVTASGRDGGALLPEYAVTATGEATMRGPAEPTARLRIGREAASTFEIGLRPATEVAEPLVAYAFALGDGEPSPLDAQVEVAASGAVRVRGAARALDQAREVRVVIGPPAVIGRFGGALERAATGAGDARVRVVTFAIERE
jgi:hypothetical protein